MLLQTITIINKLGLHARAAALFVTQASRYAADIRVRFGKREVNGKSIMGMMMLAAAKGSVIELVISGEDEVDAMSAMCTLINNRFDEAE